ncbi:MAG: four helix bundle protein [Bacilli bacterium]|nr:four helix bundle protein [Bacilli bacterium]MBP3921278.1 four helix bundle protein [Bacilli bacterium]
MLQVSRDNNLKIPKIIDDVNECINSVDDKVAVKQALATANDEKFNKKQVIQQVEEDKELERISKIPSNSNDLIVITVVKKLGAYIIAITEKSPAKYRGVFVNRMQNMCLETLELLLQANFIRIDSIENKRKREEFQKDAIIKLKMLGYISMVAENSNCILKRQFKQISLQIGEAINLVAAWKKSDDERWRNRN